MAKLPGAEQLGERPVPVLPRRTPMIASYRATSGFEGVPAEELGFAAGQTEQAAHAALQAKEQQDNLRAEEAVNKLRETQVDMTFGPKGFANLKGGDAVNKPILKEYGGAFDSAAAQIGDGLDNDYQKQLFQRRAAVSGMQLREDIGRHIVQQGNVYAETVYKSKLDVESRAAAARWQTPDAAVVPMLNIDNMINQRARLLGLSGPDGEAWVRDQHEQAESRIYANMVKSALVSDAATGPFAAKEILRLHGDAISPDMRAVLTHEVSLAARPVEARLDAQESVKAILPRADAGLQVGGQPAIDKVASYVAQTKGGTTTEGTAASEYDAYKRVAQASGMPVMTREQYTGTAAGTKVDTMALLGNAIAEGERRAEKTHPGDIVYHDMVVAQIKSEFGTIAQVQQGIQKQNYQVLVKGLMKTPDNPTPATTQEQFFANPDNRTAFDALEPTQQSGVLAHIAHNLQESLGHPMKENSDVIADAANKIFLPAGDPNRITNVGQLIPLLNHGVGTGGFGFLSGLIDKSQSINGQKFAVAANRAFQSAKSTLMHSMGGQVNPDGAADAANQYYIELQNKIDEYQQAGKDPRTLLTPGTPDSMVDRAKVMSYLQVTPKQAVAADAEKASPSPRRGGGTPAPEAPPGTMRNPKKVTDQKERDELVTGTYYVGPDGQMRQKQ